MTTKLARLSRKKVFCWFSELAQRYLKVSRQSWYHLVALVACLACAKKLHIYRNGKFLWPPRSLISLNAFLFVYCWTVKRMALLVDLSPVCFPIFARKFVSYQKTYSVEIPLWKFMWGVLCYQWLSVSLHWAMFRKWSMPLSRQLKIFSTIIDFFSTKIKEPPIIEPGTSVS